MEAKYSDFLYLLIFIFALKSRFYHLMGAKRSHKLAITQTSLSLGQIDAAGLLVDRGWIKRFSTFTML